MKIGKIALFYLDYYKTLPLAYLGCCDAQVFNLVRKEAIERTERPSNISWLCIHQFEKFRGKRKKEREKESERERK